MLLIIFFIVIFFAFGSELGYTEAFPLWKHFTYSFQHANLFHLAANSFSFFYIFKLLKRFIPPYKTVLLSYFIAVVASFVCYYPEPVVGASGMIFAMVGILFYLLITKQCRIARKPLYLFIAAIILQTVMGFIFSNIAGGLHLICLAAGMIIPLISNRLFKSPLRGI